LCKDRNKVGIPCQLNKFCHKCVVAELFIKMKFGITILWYDRSKSAVSFCIITYWFWWQRMQKFVSCWFHINHRSIKWYKMCYPKLIEMSGWNWNHVEFTKKLQNYMWNFVIIWVFQSVKKRTWANYSWKNCATSSYITFVGWYITKWKSGETAVTVSPMYGVNSNSFFQSLAELWLTAVVRIWSHFTLLQCKTGKHGFSLDCHSRSCI
jgi:hypothetical protein